MPVGGYTGSGMSFVCFLSPGGLNALDVHGKDSETTCKEFTQVER